MTTFTALLDDDVALLGGNSNCLFRFPAYPENVIGEKYKGKGNKSRNISEQWKHILIRDSCVFNNSMHELNFQLDIFFYWNRAIPFMFFLLLCCSFASKSFISFYWYQSKCLQLYKIVYQSHIVVSRMFPRGGETDITFEKSTKFFNRFTTQKNKKNEQHQTNRGKKGASRTLTFRVLFGMKV